MKSKIFYLFSKNESSIFAVKVDGGIGLFYEYSHSLRGTGQVKMYERLVNGRDRIHDDELWFRIDDEQEALNLLSTCSHSQRAIKST